MTVINDVDFNLAIYTGLLTFKKIQLNPCKKATLKKTENWFSRPINAG